ncbi:hypothetical protein RB599_002135 [Gaeumannomyces hyphopodioides]
MRSFRILRLPVLAVLHLVRPGQASGGLHDSTWTPDYVLEATTQTITLDCRERHSVVINGSSPGPTLYLTENKTTWVRVHNRMSDQNFTVHWHGLTQRVAPFSDGTPLVSQWPIAPGAFFDYELRPDAGDAGSYFYHSHVGFQAVTAHGALVVREQGPPPYEYDEELIVGLGDFFQKNDSTVVQGLLADPFQWSGEPDALLFNDRSGTAAFGNKTVDDSCRPSVVTVRPGRTYRVRFLGRTALSLVTLGIEGHQRLTVIEADGHYTQPAVTDHVQLGSGQRFSVLLQTRTEDDIAAGDGKTQFWIRFESRDRPKTVAGYALLQYDMPDSQSVPQQGQEAPLPQELPATSPVVLPTETSSWLEYTLQSLDPEEAARFPRLSEVTRTVYITMAQHLGSGEYVDGTINGTLQWAYGHTSPWHSSLLPIPHAHGGARAHTDSSSRALLALAPARIRSRGKSRRSPTTRATCPCSCDCTSPERLPTTAPHRPTRAGIRKPKRSRPWSGRRSTSCGCPTAGRLAGGTRTRCTCTGSTTGTWGRATAPTTQQSTRRHDSAAATRPRGATPPCSIGTRPRAECT